MISLALIERLKKSHDARRNVVALDLGAGRGFDTAYFLLLGFRVVAIEPNLALAAAVSDHFRDWLVSGRLKVFHAPSVRFDSGESGLQPSYIKTGDACSLPTRVPRQTKYLTIGARDASLLHALADHGFDGFKCITRTNFLPIPGCENSSGFRTLNGWPFQPGSFGPLAFQLPGPWLSFSEMLSTYERSQPRIGQSGAIFHARKRGVP